MISATVKEEAIIQNCRYQQISPNTINYFRISNIFLNRLHILVFKSSSNIFSIEYKRVFFLISFFIVSK